MIPSERLDYIACRTQPHPGVLRRRPRRPRVMAIFHRVPDLPEGGDEAELSLPPRGRKRQLDGGRARAPPRPKKPRRNASLSQRLRRSTTLTLRARRCCSHPECSDACHYRRFTAGALKDQATAWRSHWDTLTSATQRTAVLELCHECLPAVEELGCQRTCVAKRHQCRLRFLGHPLCDRAFRAVTGVNPSRAKQAYKAGERTYHTKCRPRASPRFDEMYSALTFVVDLLRKSSPFADDDADTVLLPFHHKVVMYDMLRSAFWEPSRFEASAASSATHGLRFTREPRRRTFWRVLAHPDFAKVKFHRCVKIGRCPSCCLFRYKVAAARTEPERDAWRRVMNAHQLLQLEQKREYVKARSKAAYDYPESELYMGFDGGSGYEFWLPHLSPSAAETVNKAADKAHTPGLKVMNGIVHGAPCSHVMLSPWSITAGSNHVCECVAVAVNTCVLDHGRLPPMLTVQADNSSVNHSNCLLGFLAVYVLLGCFTSARLRFMLENHAHDIYDAFHGVTKRAVERHTFYSLEELIDIIKGAHSLARESLPAAASAGGASASASAASAADRTTPGGWGSDVRVTNVFEVRDVWEWLFPQRDGSRGACVYFEGIAPYHDFELRRETAPGNVKVQLWAKQYMTSQTYAFVGTITTWKLYQACLHKAMPAVAVDGNTPAREKAKTAGLHELDKLVKGKYREQFTADRLADARAMCNKDWRRFAESAGACPLSDPRRMLPPQLAVYMNRRGLRRVGRTASTASAAAAAPAAEDATAPPPITMVAHSLGESVGLRRGAETEVARRGGHAAKTVDEFLASHVAAGQYVVTAGYPHSGVGRASPKLERLHVWVWKVLRIYRGKQRLPQNSKKKVHAEEAATSVYEAHLHAPTGRDLGDPMRPVWDKRRGVEFLLAPEEKQGAANRAASQPAEHAAASVAPAGAETEEGCSEGTVACPITAFLRPVNIIGGGFWLTPGRRVPTLVREAAVGVLNGICSRGS